MPILNEFSLMIEDCPRIVSQSHREMLPFPHLTLKMVPIQLGDYSDACESWYCHHQREKHGNRLSLSHWISCSGQIHSISSPQGVENKESRNSSREKGSVHAVRPTLKLWKDFGIWDYLVTLFVEWSDVKPQIKNIYIRGSNHNVMRFFLGFLYKK